jgi:hypothetical protein
MKTWLFFALLCGAAVVSAFQTMPRCTAIEPDTGKVGDAVVMKGESLDKSAVSEVYLTDGTKDTKVVVMAQGAAEIKFTIPKINPGRYHVAVLSANKANFIEQPVVLTVE